MYGLIECEKIYKLCFDIKNVKIFMLVLMYSLGERFFLDFINVLFVYVLDVV